VRAQITLRRLVWLLLGLLILFSIIGVTGGRWAEVWLPNYSAEAAGLLATVLVVERVLERELDRRRRSEEAPLRRSAQQRLRLALSPLFATLISDHVGSDASLPLPPPINDPQEFLTTVQHDITTPRREAATWIGSWILEADEAQQFVGEVEETADRLQGVLDRAARVLEPHQEAVIEAFLVWRATSVRSSPPTLAALKAKPGDAWAHLIDELVDQYLAELFKHLQALVALHDDLGPERFSLAEEWSSATAEIKLIRAIFNIDDEGHGEAGDSTVDRPHLNGE
jgi:hypothetical protein